MSGWWLFRLIPIAAAASQAPRVDRGSLPLHVVGRYIVAQDGVTRVKLSCVNWAGAQLSKLVPAGLHLRTPEYLAKAIVQIGFNCVRLVYSLQALTAPHADPFWLGNNGSEEEAWINPRLQGSSPIQVLDAVVQASIAAGLAVILNNHNSDAGWCCSETDENGLWWNTNFSAKAWLSHVRQLALRYSTPTYGGMVIGFDLRNELRAAKISGRWFQPSWGEQPSDVDWRRAAIEAAAHVLHNSQMLVVVEGVDFSANLCGVEEKQLPGWMRNRTVYSAHQYSWYQMGLHLPSKIYDLSMWTHFRICICWVLGTVVFCGLLLRREEQRLRCVHRGACCLVVLGSTMLVVCIFIWLLGLVCGVVARSVTVVVEILGLTNVLWGTCYLWRSPSQALLRVACGRSNGGVQGACRWMLQARSRIASDGAQQQCQQEPGPSLEAWGHRGDTTHASSRQSRPLFLHALFVRRGLCHVSVWTIAAAPVFFHGSVHAVRMAHSTQWLWQAEADAKWGRLLRVQGSSGSNCGNKNELLPVWVGEYGPGFEDRRRQFDYFIHHDIDLSYWQMAAENGLDANNQFKEESFGMFLLDYNYSNLRQPPELMALIRQTFEPRVTHVNGRNQTRCL